MKQHQARSILAMSLSFAACLTPGTLQAQSRAQANPEAVALFQEARVLMANGNFRPACPKLEVSLGIEWGMGTLYNLAECYERLGREASAWAGFRDVLIMATTLGQTERAQAVRERLVAAESKRSKLRILVAPEAAASGVAVRRDGVAVSPLVWGMEVPVDPGTYLVTASALGRVDWAASVEIKEPGKAVTARVPILEPGIAAGTSRGGTASPPVPLTAEDTKAAWFFDEGVTAADAEQWTKARESLLSAWRIRPDWRVAAELGRAELMLGKRLEAIEHLGNFVQRAPASVPSVERQNARALLETARSSFGMLTVKVNARGAEVLVDGKAVGRVPLVQPILVEPGRRTIEARLEGRAPERALVEVTPGLVKEIVFTFSGPRGEGSDLGGSADTGRGPEWEKWGIIAGTGFAVVGLGVGIGFTVAASGKREEVEAELIKLRESTPVGEYVCPTRGLQRCAFYEDALDSNRVLNAVAITGYVIGGVAAAGTLALVFWPSSGAKSASLLSIRPVPIVTSTHGGLLVTGAF